MNETVHYELDINNPPPLTEQQRAELEALKVLPDTEMDLSDIPPLIDEFWKHAARNPFYKPTKASTTVRIDTDVLAWIKSKGKGYQTRINSILRHAMLEELREQPR